MTSLPMTMEYRSDLSGGAAELDRFLSGIAAGDPDALELLYHSTCTSVYTFALSILKNSHDAEDVLQDCYLHIHAGAGNYRTFGKPMAWILTITKNLCFRKLRERQKFADLPQEDWEPWLAADAGLSHEDRVVIRQCMEQLSDEERQIVTLHAVTGLRHREISELLELPLSTVLSKYNRAIKKLRKYL